MQNICSNHCKIIKYLYNENTRWCSYEKIKK
nr:MAG TPA: hypothetical protein [Caudoviricetes sp.]